MPPKDSGKKPPLASLARYSEIGFILPSAVLLGFFLGKLLDYWLHTKWLYLAGLLFGAVVGFWQVIKMALSAFGEGSEKSSSLNSSSRGSSSSGSSTKND